MLWCTCAGCTREACPGAPIRLCRAIGKGGGELVGAAELPPGLCIVGYSHVHGISEDLHSVVSLRFFEMQKDLLTLQISPR